MAEKPKINWQWLKDSNNEYSYARVVGTICIATNLLLIFLYKPMNINNLYNLIAYCSPFLTGVLLWLIEIFRKLPNMSVKIGDKEYTIRRESDG
jgi:hypothetical protein